MAQRHRGIFANRETKKGSDLAPTRGGGAFDRPRLVDVAARDLGIDCVEIRTRNFIPRDAFPHQTRVMLKYDSGDHVLRWRRRDRQRVRRPLCRARDASGRGAAHDAQRDRVVDPPDRNDAAFGRHLSASIVLPGHPRLAGRGDFSRSSYRCRRGQSAAISRTLS
jgi:CO/xanthine dehydrogenase Mo-binding subunit